MSAPLTVLNHPVVYEPACAVGAVSLADLPRLCAEETPPDLPVRRAKETLRAASAG